MDEISSRTALGELTSFARQAPILAYRTARAFPHSASSAFGVPITAAVLGSPVDGWESTSVWSGSGSTDRFRGGKWLSAVL